MMEGFRRARTSYDVYGDMPMDDYFAQMGSIHPLAGSQTARVPGAHTSRPRTRAGAYTPRASSFDLQGANTNPFTGSMDPVNQQYYYREWARQPPSPRQPIFRSGRLGSPWRHVKSCINNGGSHLVFIDGTVKTEENFFYPPEETMQPPDLSMYVSPRLARRSLSRGRADLTSTFNDRAKQGFKYWYNDPKPINLSARGEFGGRTRWLGVSGESLASRNPRFAVKY